MDRMKTIALTVMEVDVYASKEPGGAIVSALLKHIGATNITTGRRQLGYEKFNLMMDAVSCRLHQLALKLQCPDSKKHCCRLKCILWHFMLGAETSPVREFFPAMS